MPAISPRTAPAEMTLISAAVAGVARSNAVIDIAKLRLRIMLSPPAAAARTDGIISEAGELCERACRVGKGARAVNVRLSAKLVGAPCPRAAEPQAPSVVKGR